MVFEMFDLFCRPANERSTSTLTTARLDAAEPTFVLPHFESMESKLLLDVSLAEFSQLRDQYPELNLAAEMASYNIIEITAEQLSAASLRAALATASATPANDLIVVRTDSGHSVVDLGDSFVTVDVNSSRFGSVAIVSLGSDKLWIQGTSSFGVVGVANGSVSLGGVVLSGVNNTLNIDDVLRTLPTAQVVLSDFVKLVEREGPNGNYSSSDDPYYVDANISGPMLTGAGSPIGSKTYDVDVIVSGTRHAYLAGLTLTERNNIIANPTTFLNSLSTYVPNPYDAEKTGVGDENHCWAATSANMLAYTGWGDVSTFQTEDAILQYFTSNFDDNGGNAYFGNEWFLTGNYQRAGSTYRAQGWAQLRVAGGGGFYSSTISSTTRTGYTSYTSIAGTMSVTVSNIASAINKLKSGSAIGLAVAWVGYNGAGHAQTVWGFGYDTQYSTSSTSYYTSIFLTDSDDNFGGGAGAPNRLRYYNLTWSSSLGAYTMVCTYSNGSSTAMLSAFQWLDKRPDAAVSTPQNFRASGSTATTVSFAWTGVTGATGYEIQWKASSSSTWSDSNIRVVNGQDKVTDTVSGLTQGVSYDFRIRAANGATKSNWSSIVTAMPTPDAPPAPTSLSVSGVSATSATLTWSQSPGATGYTVEWWSGTTRVGTRSVTSLTTLIETLSAETTYTFRVYATANGKTSDKDIATTATTLAPAAPTSLTVSNLAAKSVTLTWAQSAGASGYKIEWHDNSLSGNTLVGSKTVSGGGTLTTDVTGLQPETTYSFRVYALGSGPAANYTSYRSTSARTLPDAAPLAPASVAASNITSSSVKLTWAQSTGATGYTVEWYIGTERKGSRAVGNVLTTDITGLLSNSTYTFRVYATGSGYTSAGYASTTASTLATVAPPAPSSVVASNITTSDVTLTWTQSSGATGYAIEWYVGTVRQGTKTVSGGNVLTTAVTGLTPDTSYTFRVYATGNGATSTSYASASARTTSDPGDTIATAMSVTFTNGTFSSGVQRIGDGSYGTKDVDMFQFTVSASDVGKVFTFRTALPAGQSSVDTYIRLFNSSGTQLAYDDDGGGSLYSYLSWTPTAAGTYYLGVSSYGNRTYSPTAAGSGPGGATGYYTLTIASSASEPGDTLATAAPVTFSGTTFSSGTQQIGDGAYGSRDVDMYSFTVSAADIGKTFTFRTAQPSGYSSVDTYIKLFNSSGTVLSYDDDGGGNLYSLLSWTPTTAGTYYLGVSSYSNRTYTPTVANSGPGGTTGYYTLTITTSAATSEPGDTLATARAVTFSGGTFSSGTQQIGDGAYGSRDVDMFQFTVSAADIGKTFTFRTAQPAGYSSVDTYIRLFNSSGTQLAYDDDGGGSLYSLLSWTPTSAGTYYLGVSSYSNRSYSPTAAGSGPGGTTGYYTLSITTATAEPGDTLATAAPVTFSGTTFSSGTQQIGDGAYGSRDVDMFQFTVSSADIGKTFTFRTAQPAGYSSVDTYIKLFNASGTVLTYDDDSGGNLYSYLSWTPTAAGTYYLGVSSYGNRTYTPTVAGSGPGGSTGYYTLTITASVSDIGDTFATAASVTFSGGTYSSGTQQIGDGLYGSRDVDMFQFTVSSADIGRTFTFRTAQPSGYSSVDTYIKLFNSSGTVLSYNDDGGGNLYSLLSWTPTSAGTYYLGVSSYGNQSYSPTVAGSGPGGTTGYYTLSITVAAAVSEPGDTLATAQSVTFSGGTYSSGTQRIGDGAYGTKDVDMFQFTVSAADVGKTFTFRTAQPAGQSSVDTYIRLFNSSGTQLAYDDDGGGNLYSLLSWTPTTAGTYYLGVSSYGNRSYSPTVANSGPGGATGYYALTITVTAPPVTQLSTPTGVTAVSRNATSLTVSWNTVSNASGYQIQYATNSSFTGAYTQTVSGGSTQTADITGLSTGTVYYVRVLATGTGYYSNSAYSGAVSATPTSEPGDTIAAATTVTFSGGTFSSGTQRIGDGAYGTKDVDMFQFTVSAADVGKTFTFRTAQPAGYSSVDTYIRLFNSSGTQLAYDDDGGGNYYSYLSWTPTTAGTYYLGVSSYGNRSYSPTVANSGPGGTTGYYTLTIMASASDPGDTIATALNVTFTSGTFASGTQQIGDGAYGSRDVDMFKFTVSASDVGKPFTFRTAQPSGQSSVDTYIKLFNSNGTVLAYDDDSGGNLYSYLSWTPTAAGTYYLGVSSYCNSNYNPTVAGSGPGGTTGYYTLTITAPPPGTPQLTTPSGVTVSGRNATTLTVSWNTVSSASGYQIQYATNSSFTGAYTVTVSGGSTQTADITGLSTGTVYYVRVLATGTGNYSNSAYSNAVSATPASEPGDTIAAAMAVTFTGGTFSSGVQRIGDGAYGTKDVDMFQFTVSSADVGRAFTFRTAQPSGYASVDTYIRLFNSSGTQLAYDDDGGDNLYSYLSWTPTSAGTYYLGVSSYGNQSYSPTVANSGPGGATGYYTLTITAPMTVSMSDPGDTIATAMNVTFSGGTFSSGVQRIGDGAYGSRDVDMYKVTVSAADVGRTFIFRTAQPAGYSEVDTYIKLFNSSGTVLAYDDDGGSGLYSLLYWTPTAAGTYYLGVSSYDNRSYTPTVAGSGSASSSGETGYYTLTITI